jgi:hypothetical protein
MSSQISPKKRQKVFDKTGGKCWYCGKMTGDDFVVEHAHPRSRGGNNDIDNLLPACRACNSRKHNRDIEEYREYLMSQDPPRKASVEIIKTMVASGRQADDELLFSALSCLRKRFDPLIFYGEQSTINNPEADTPGSETLDQ